MPTAHANTPRKTAATTTEAAVLALLELGGELSGYDLLKQAGRSVGYVWAPARSRLYTVLPRLVRDGLASRRHVRQEQRPDKHLYRITAEGRRVLRDWLETVEPGAEDAFYLRLFVGGLVEPETLVAHVEQFRRDTESRLAEYRQIEPTNSRTGHDAFHFLLLRLGIEQAELRLRWAGAVLADLRAGEPEA